MSLNFAIRSFSDSRWTCIDYSYSGKNCGACDELDMCNCRPGTQRIVILHGVRFSLFGLEDAYAILLWFGHIPDVFMIPGTTGMMAFAMDSAQM